MRKHWVRRLGSYVLGKRDDRRSGALRARRIQLEPLEERHLLTATVYLDFGDNFPAGGLTDTEANLVAAGVLGPDFSAVNADITLTSFAAEVAANNIDYDNAGAAGDAADAASLRAAIVQLVERYYDPFDITVAELTSVNQNVNGHNVRAAANLTDVQNTLGANNADSEHWDSYVFVTGLVGTAQHAVTGVTAAAAGGGSFTVAGNLTDSDLDSVHVGRQLRITGSTGNDGTYTISGGVFNAGPNETVISVNEAVPDATADGQLQLPDAISSGLHGQAGGGEWNGTNTVDSTAVVLANHILSNVPTADSDTALGYTTTHEAGHTLGLEHTVNAIGSSADTIMLTESDMISQFWSSVPSQLSNLNFFTRFPLPTVDGVPANQNSALDLANDMGPAPQDLSYITGTGAFDLITVTRASATLANISVAAHRDNTFANQIATHTYQVNYTSGLLIDGGFRQDRIVVDASLGTTVTVRGMEGDDQLVVQGSNLTNGTYTPGNAIDTSLDGNNNYQGTITVGATSINFSEFDAGSSVTIQDLTNLTLVTPNSQDSLSIDSPAAGQNRVTGTSDSVAFVPLTFYDVGNFTIDMGANDAVSPDDSFSMTSSLVASGLAAFTVEGGMGNDVFSVVPSTAAKITVNGGNPVNGDPGVPPGDVLAVDLTMASGVNLPPKNATSGTITSDSHQDVSFTSIETLISPDRFEFNDTLEQATVLGSQSETILRDLSIHNADDVDYFRVTAHDTGKLVVNALFDHTIGDIDMTIRDRNDNVIVSAVSMTDDEQLVIPVVGQETYYVRVHGVGSAINNYSLEIENFAAPIPDAVVLDPSDDNGWSDSDNLTCEATPRILIEADLSDFADDGIVILTPAQAAAGEEGAAVEVFVNGTSVGYATVIAGTDNTLFEYDIEAGELSTTFIPVPGGGGLNFVKAAVRIFDGQEDAEGEPDPADGRTLQSEPLLLTLDTTAPDASTPDLLASSDTGTFDDDNVTRIDRPAFAGVAEANARVRVYADGLLVGEGMVGKDATHETEGLGVWEITVEPLDDGIYEITTVVDDPACNLSEVSEALQIEIDTTVPNTPWLDLLAADDSGRSNEDNITNVFEPRLDSVVEDPNGPEGHLLPDENVVFRIFDRFDTQGEAQVFASAALHGNGAFLNAVDLRRLAETVGDENDGLHGLKLEVEDRAGNISPDFLLEILLDRVAPPVTIVGIDPGATDTGIADQPETYVDRITSDTQTGFVGTAEADSIVRMWADGDPISVNAIDEDVFQGLTVALPEDGNYAFPLGQWNLAGQYDLNDPDAGFPLDGVRQIGVTAEDVAGNMSEPDFLDIFIDTRGPQVNSVQITSAPSYHLFDPKPSYDGPTPLVHSIDIEFIDQPERVGGEVLIVGDDAVFVIDVSGSTGDPFAGTPVGDLNGDGDADTILDAEIAGFLALNQQLIARGLGDISNVSIVTFASGAYQVDMDPVTAGVQLATTPNADQDGNGVLDVEDALRALTSSSSTNFEIALQTAISTIAAVGTEAANGNVIFLSDGFPNEGDAYNDEVATLRGLGHNLRAFGVGSNSALPELQIIDPLAVQFTSTDELLDAFGGGSSGANSGSTTGTFVYPAVNEMLATAPGNIVLQGDYNGVIPIESIEFLDNTVAGDIGRTTIRVHFVDPLPDDRFTLTVSDRITDRAFNALDGESQLQEPHDAPQFPSGDGVPGEDFLARFTVDSRPEVATYAAGSVWADTNGNGSFDPDNLDFTNRDITYNLGFASDALFVGNFVTDANASADRFDKLAAYGQVPGGGFRWLVDTDNNGVPNDLDSDGDQMTIDPLQLNGLPVAGRFDDNDLNGDEVGLYTAEPTSGSVWYFDTDHNFMLDASSALFSQLHGVPIVGDFDHDGFDDLGAWENDTFSIDLAKGVRRGWDGVIDVSFHYGFVGVREQPVVADVDQDGFDDLGLWVPDRSGVTPSEGSEWYILVSDGASVLDRIVLNADLGVPAIDFTPVPFGPDLYMQFGDEYAMPLLGNFDPPVTSGGVVASGVLHLEGTEGDDEFLFDAGADGQTWTVTVNGTVQDIPDDTNLVLFDGLGGQDTAFLRGSDGDDLFASGPAGATLSGTDFAVTVENVEITHGYGMGGNDHATLNDSSGNDKFKAKVMEDYAKMMGGGHFTRAKFFETVTGVFSEGEDDYARVWDTNADDVLTASPSELTLTGGGYTVNVQAFDRLLAYSTYLGNDTVDLYDSAGDDILRARSHKTLFWGPGFDMTLRRWEDVRAHADNGGYDVAKLHDTLGDDVILTGDNWASLSTIVEEDVELLYTVYGFETVRGYHTEGNDKAPAPANVDFLMLDDEADWELE